MSELETQLYKDPTPSEEHRLTGSPEQWKDWRSPEEKFFEEGQIRKNFKPSDYWKNGGIDYKLLEECNIAEREQVYQEFMFNEWGEDGKAQFNPNVKEVKQNLSVNDYLDQLTAMKESDQKKFEKTDSQIKEMKDLILL